MTMRSPNSNERGNCGRRSRVQPQRSPLELNGSINQIRILRWVSLRDIRWQQGACHLTLSRYTGSNTNEKRCEGRTRGGMAGASCYRDTRRALPRGRSSVYDGERQTELGGRHRGEAWLNWRREEARNFTSRREGTGGQAPVICNPYA